MAKPDVDNVGTGRAAKGAIPVDRTTKKGIPNEGFPFLLFVR